MEGTGITPSRFALSGRLTALLGLALVLLAPAAGCYAPLVHHGVPAAKLPESFRVPIRSAGPPLNLSSLTLPPPRDYLLGPGDVLDVTIYGLYPGAELQPVRARVMSNGEIYLPILGGVSVGGMNLLEAQQAVARAAEDGYLPAGERARVNVVLVEKVAFAVVVLGEVLRPGTYLLPKYENDVGHAVAAAGGLNEDAANAIEIHRRIVPPWAEGFAPHCTRLPPVEPIPTHGGEATFEPIPAPAAAPMHGPMAPLAGMTPLGIQTIPLRGVPPGAIQPHDVALGDGDVVVVRSRRNDVFYVVGRLATTNFVRFNVGARERDLGTGFLLPRDRDVDVVTAVVMAGYIDPIDSPTTVTVHRRGPNGEPLLIVVDLIKARYDREATVIIQPGDIIYLNPDAPWWFRRTFDRVVDDLIIIPYQKLFR